MVSISLAEDCLLLASAICPLVSEAKRLVLVSQWEGLLPANWWVELSLVTLVGRFIFIKILSSLSVDGWSCVPILLVFWLRHPRTGTYRLLGGAGL